MNVKQILATIGVVAAVTMSAASLNRGVPEVQVNVPPSNPTPIQVNVPRQDAPIVNVAPAKVDVKVPTQSPTSQVFGSVTGPDFYGPYSALNGVKRYADRRQFSFTQGNGTTTPCAFRLPSSTSTPVFVSFTNTTSTSTALTVTIATSTTAFATTTSMASVIIPSGQTKEFSWLPSTITGGVGSAAPNTYIVFGVQGGTGSGTTGVVLSGTCQYEAIAL